MLGVHKSISLPQATEYAKEMAKWEAQDSQWGKAGRPYVFQEFPKRMYRAAHVAGKGAEVVEAHTVNTVDEERNLQSRGFYFGQAAAFEAVRQTQTEFGKLAAEREHEIQHGRLSERATNEVRAAEAAHGSTHMPMVPETPIKRRGRKPKVAPSVAPSTDL